MQKFSLEFILNIRAASIEEIRGSLSGLGEGLVISGPEQDSPGSQDLKISIHTEDPTLIFDTCSQFGKLKSVKID
jgi:dihydroxyacetone kinase-like predicted kinase